jgi:hypothetical protein
VGGTELEESEPREVGGTELEESEPREVGEYDGSRTPDWLRMPSETSSAAAFETQFFVAGTSRVSVHGVLPPQLLVLLSTQNTVVPTMEGKRVHVYRYGRATRVGSLVVDLDSFDAHNVTYECTTSDRGIAPLKRQTIIQQSRKARERFERR